MGRLSLATVLIVAVFVISEFTVNVHSRQQQQQQQQGRSLFSDIDGMVSGKFAALNKNRNSGRIDVNREIDDLVSKSFRRNNGRAFKGKGRTVPLVYLGKSPKGRGFGLSAQSYKIVELRLGDKCTRGGAPVGPGGSWQSVGSIVDYRCPRGSTCRKGACNCDDLDGTVMSISTDYDRREQSCRKVADQRCSADDECFHTSNCIRGICVCDFSQDELCVDYKREVMIMN